MIDYVKLSHSVALSPKLFSRMKWKHLKTDDGQPYYLRTIRGVKLRYYELSQRFTISGKILMLLHDTQVQNMDDIYGARTDLFLEELNEALNKLFPYPVLDIRDFKVTKIDYCFNVETPYVRTYLTFLEKAFHMTGIGKVNFTQKHNLDGSVYVKTQADYRNNTNKNYILNFYDKTDRLHYLKENGHYISEADFALAKDVLRLEIQCGHQMIKRQTEKFNIDNTFNNLLSFQIAYDTIATAYTRVFKGSSTTDFFTYAAAKLLLKGKPAALKTIYVATSHRITDRQYYHGSSQAKKAGIYPHCFLDRKSVPSSLKNPLKLLQEKLMTYGAFPL